jgi:capsid protein
MQLPSVVTRFLGYDAISSRGRRRSPATRTKAEDLILPDRDRRKLLSTAQDVQRNFAIAAWAVRQHLNYVSSFSFQSKTGTDFDDEVEAFMNWWSRRINCDIRRQHPFRRMIRLAEARRVVDGDFFFLKLAGTAGSRGKLQAIESDRVATAMKGPAGYNTDSWTNGVKTSAGGAPKEYTICKRSNYGELEFERIVPADSIFSIGYYDRFDQLRGISPIATALNSLQDCYEGMDYALAKLKVSQLFGLVFYRDAEMGLATTTATTDSDSDGFADSGYEVDFGAGPVQLDLNPGDRAEFLEARTPATETVEFLKLMVHVSLKALDLPFSFFDESHTNFYGSRGALMNYMKSCKAKIADLQELLDDITLWRLGMAIFDGDLALPPGMEFTDLRWEWVPDGVPWWDPAKEVRGNVTAIAAGLDNPQRICRETGTDYYENIDQIAEAMAYASSKGVTLQLAVPGMSSMESQPQDNTETESQV